MDFQKTYLSVYTSFNARLLGALFLVLIVCLSNVLDLKNEIQYEVEKIELTDSEFETDFEEKEKTKEIEKSLIINSDIDYSSIQSAFLSYLGYINRPTSYYSNIPTPPPDIS